MIEPEPAFVQFGRARRSPWHFVPYAIPFAVWLFTHWPFSTVEHLAFTVVSGLLLCGICYWTGKDFDRGARVMPGRVILRRGRQEEEISASAVTDIRVVETSGVFARSVHVRIELGRFDAFDVVAAKAPKTSEGRERLQARVDAALATLRAGTSEV